MPVGNKPDIHVPQSMKPTDSLVPLIRHGHERPGVETCPGFDHIWETAFTWNTEKSGCSYPRICDEY